MYSLYLIYLDKNIDCAQCRQKFLVNSSNKTNDTSIKLSHKCDEPDKTPNDKSVINSEDKGEVKKKKKRRKHKKKKKKTEEVKDQA